MPGYRSTYTGAQIDEAVERGLLTPEQLAGIVGLTTHLKSSPEMPEPGGLKLVVGGTSAYPGKFFVLSKGGGGHGVLTEFVTGNIATPSLPSSSENGAWEFWRTGIVSALDFAWAWKGVTSEAGTWADSNANLSEVTTDANVAAFLAIHSRRSTVVGGIATFEVVVPKSGKISIGFRCTSTSPTSQPIKVDGVVVKTVNLADTVPTIVTVEIEATPGARTITIEHDATGSNLYIIGVNFTELSDLTRWDIEVDKWAAYARSPGYVTNRGASDYAFKSDGAGTWAGSYHGGETARAAAEFSLDHQLITIADDMVYVGRRLSILQQTSLAWVGTSESMDIDSLTIVGDGSVYMSAVASSVDLTADTAYLGMATTSPSFDSVIGGAFYGVATVDGTNYNLGLSQSATQIERGTGRLLTTEFSPPPLVNSPTFNGMTVTFATGAYAKLYPTFVRNSNQVLPASFSWSFVRKFH